MEILGIGIGVKKVVLLRSAPNYAKAVTFIFNGKSSDSEQDSTPIPTPTWHSSSCRLFAKCDTFCGDNIISLEKLFVISMAMVAVPPKTVNVKAAEKFARK